MEAVNGGIETETGFFKRRRHSVWIVELHEDLIGIAGMDKQGVFGKRDYADFFSFAGFRSRKTVVYNRAEVTITALQTACDGVHPVVMHG